MPSCAKLCSDLRKRAHLTLIRRPYDTYDSDSDLIRKGSNGSSTKSAESGSQESSLSSKSDVNVQHVKFDLDLEDDSSNDSELNDTSIPNNELESEHCEESECYTQDEFEVAVEIYEEKIQQLEKLVRTLKLNVEQLINDAKVTTISKDVKKVVEIEYCRSCGGERVVNSPEESIYVDMIMKEDKLKRKNKKLHVALKSKMELTRQLSMNLKTASDSITDTGKERDEWKAKYKELEERTLLGVLGMFE